MERQGPAGTPPHQGPPGSERRAAPRQASSLKVACYPVNSGFTERRQARVRNISRTGVGLAIDRSWPPGTALIIELPAEEGAKAVRARVIHSTAQVGGTFLVGCTFDIPLSDADVQSLAR